MISAEMAEMAVKIGLVPDIDADEFMASLRNDPEMEAILEPTAEAIELGRSMGISDLAILISVKDALASIRIARESDEEE